MAPSALEGSRWSHTAVHPVHHPGQADQPSISPADWTSPTSPRLLEGVAENRWFQGTAGGRLETPVESQLSTAISEGDF